MKLSLSYLIYFASHFIFLITFTTYVNKSWRHTSLYCSPNYAVVYRWFSYLDKCNKHSDLLIASLRLICGLTVPKFILNCLKLVLSGFLIIMSSSHWYNWSCFIKISLQQCHLNDVFKFVFYTKWLKRFEWNFD